MSPESLYTPKSLRELADAVPSPFRPFLMDEYRKALRWAADVIEAADAVIEENERIRSRGSPLQRMHEIDLKMGEEP